MQRVHFQVRVGVFNCQQVLTEISFVIFDIVVKTNRMWFSVVCAFIDNDTGRHSGQNLFWNRVARIEQLFWFSHACEHKQNVHGNLNGFSVTFSTIFTSYLSSNFENLSSRYNHLAGGDYRGKEHDAILGQWERDDFYDHLSNYTKGL